jgi:hypothetical protein
LFQKRARWEIFGPKEKYNKALEITAYRNARKFVFFTSYSKSITGDWPRQGSRTKNGNKYKI